MNFNIKGTKKIFFIVLGLLVLLSGIFIYFKVSHGGKKLPPGSGQQLPASVQVKTFRGTNPPFNFTFEYPAVWKAHEVITPQDFNMVQVRGPQDSRTKVIPGIFVTVRTVTVKMTPSEIADAILAKERRIKGFKEISRKEDLVGGVEALRVIFQYILPLPMRSKNAKDTPVKRQEVYLVRKDKEYRISFWLTEEQYKIYKSDLDRALETFQFLD
jgi:hypothetical protein